VSLYFAHQRFLGPPSFPQKHIGVLHIVGPCEQATIEEVTALLRPSQTETAGTMGHFCALGCVLCARRLGLRTLAKQNRPSNLLLTTEIDHGGGAWLSHQKEVRFTDTSERTAGYNTQGLYNALLRMMWIIERFRLSEMALSSPPGMVLIFKLYLLQPGRMCSEVRYRLPKTTLYTLFPCSLKTRNRALSASTTIKHLSNTIQN
jgi:hypothetical protein